MCRTDGQTDGRTEGTAVTNTALAMRALRRAVKTNQALDAVIFRHSGSQKGANLYLQYTKMRLAAGLCPDPLGELMRSPGPLAAIRGPTSKGEGGEGM